MAEASSSRITYYDVTHCDDVEQLETADAGIILTVQHEEDTEQNLEDDDNFEDPLELQEFLNSDDPEYLKGSEDHESQLLVTVGSVRFQTGREMRGECRVCLEEGHVYGRVCCDTNVCITCLTKYTEAQVSQGNIKLTCIGTDCSVAIHRDEILALLDDQFRTKYNQFLVDANKDQRSKTCPRCSHVMVVENVAALMRKPQIRRYGHRVVCPACGLDWCFSCQAPWHEPLKCKVFRNGDALLKRWARGERSGHNNAQMCPKCQVYIERKVGCDHMTCSQCKTEFCYKCGERYREFKFIGDHRDQFSILGCKYNFLPHNPVRRKLIRGSLFGAKMLVAPVIGGVIAGAGVVMIGAGALVLPVYGVYRVHKRAQKKKKNKKPSCHCTLKTRARIPLVNYKHSLFVH